MKINHQTINILSISYQYSSVFKAIGDIVLMYKETKGEKLFGAIRMDENGCECPNSFFPLVKTYKRLIDSQGKVDCKIFVLHSIKTK
jgi:hypothetical protein